MEPVRHNTPIKGLTTIKSFGDLSPSEYSKWRKENEEFLKKHRGISREGLEKIYNIRRLQKSYGNDLVKQYGYEAMLDYEKRQNKANNDIAIYEDTEKWSNPFDENGNVDPRKGVGSADLYRKIISMSPEAQLELRNSNWLSPWEMEAKKREERENTRKAFDTFASPEQRARTTGDVENLTNLQHERHMDADNDNLFNSIYNKDIEKQKKSLTPLIQKELSEVNNNIKDEDVDSEFMLTAMPNFDNQYAGIPQLAAFFDKNGKSKSHETASMTLDEKREWIARARAYAKAFPENPGLVYDILDKEAKDYLNDHQSGWDYFKALNNDMFIGATAYTADKLNSLRHLYIAARETLPVGSYFGYDSETVGAFMTPDGQYVDKRHVSASLDGYIYIDPYSKKEIPVTYEQVSRSNLDLQGMSEDGTERDNFWNNRYWSKAEMTGEWDRESQAEAENLNGYSSKQAVYKLGNDKDYLWETIKMGQFALADIAMTALPMGIGAAGKALETASWAAKAAQYGLYGFKDLGRAISLTARGMEIANPTLGALGIGHAYGRNAYTEMLNSNVEKLQGWARTQAEENFKRNMENADFKESIRKEVEIRANEIYNKTIDPRTAAQMSREELNNYYRKALEQAQIEVTQAHIDNDSEEIKNTPEFAHKVSQGAEEAADAAEVASWTDAAKYVLVNNFGFRKYLYKNPLKRVDSSTSKALEKGVTNNAKTNRLTFKEQWKDMSRWQKAGLLGKIGAQQFFGGAWTNFTDEMQVAGAKAINEASMNNMIDNDPQTTADIGFWGSLGYYWSGANRNIIEDQTWSAGLVGGLGSIAPSLAPNLSMMVSGTFRQRLRDAWKDNHTAASKVAGVYNVLFSNGVLTNYFDIREGEKQAKKIVGKANKLLDEYENFKPIRNIITSDIAAKALKGEEADVMEFVKATQIANEMIRMGNDKNLRELKGTLMNSNLFNDAMTFVDKILNDELTDEEVKDMLTEYYANNKDIAKSEENDRIAMEHIRSNAESFKNSIEVAQEIDKIIDKIEKRTGKSVNAGVRDIITQKFATSHIAEQTISKLEEGLTGNKETSKNKVGREVYGSEASINKRLGDIKDLRKKVANRKNEIQSEIDKINDEIDDINAYSTATRVNTNGLTKREIMKLAMLKMQKSLLQGELKGLEHQDNITATKENELSRYLEDKSERRVLKAEEIMNLSPEERAIMLDNDNYNDYSLEQQAEISTAKQELAQKDSEYAEHVNTIARLQQIKDISDYAYNELLSNPEAAADYLEAAEEEYYNRFYHAKARESARVMNRMIENIDSAPSSTQAEIEKVIFEELFQTGTKNIDMLKSYLDSELPGLQKYSHVIEKAINSLESKDTVHTLLDSMSKSKDITEDQAHQIKSILEDYLRNTEDIDDLINTINDLSKNDATLEDLKKGLEELTRKLLKLNNKETSSSNAPSPITVDPSVGHDDASSTPAAPESNKPVGEEAPSPIPGTTNKGEEKKESSEEKNRDEKTDVEEAVEVMTNVINNTEGFTEEEKTEALNYINNLDTDAYDNAEAIIDNVIRIVNERLAESEGEDNVASLLNTAQAKASLNNNQKKTREKNASEKKQATEPSVKTEEKKKTVWEEIEENAKRALGDVVDALSDFFKMFTQGTPNSAFISSLNMAWMKKKRGETPVVDYWDQYGCDAFLLANANMRSGTPVRFITDASLTQAVFTSIGQSNYDVSRDLPIVAVVEVTDKMTKTDKKVPDIVIEGKTYQPVGIMPSTGHQGVPGSNHMLRVRNLAKNNTGDIEFVKNEDGSIIETALSRPPIVKHRDINYRGSNSVIELTKQDMTEKEKAEVDNSRGKKNKPKAYKKARKAFFDRLELKEFKTPEGKKYKQFVYRQEKETSNPIRIQIKSLSELKDAYGKSLEEHIKSGEPFSNFNALTERAARQLLKLFKDFKVALTIKDGKAVPVDSIARKQLNEFKQKIQSRINNSFWINYKSGWNIDIELTPEDNGKVTVDVFLKNKDTDDKIFLGSFIPSRKNNNENIDDILINLIYDAYNNKYRDFITPQVDYTLLEEYRKGDKDAIRDLEKIYDEDIFEIAATSLHSTVGGVAVQKPADPSMPKAPAAPPAPEIGNGDNASGPKNSSPLGVGGMKGNKGKPVNIDGGNSSDAGKGNDESGQGSQKSRFEKTIDIVKNKIRKVVEYFDSNPTKTHYTSNEGKAWLRVTTGKNADVSAGNRYGQYEYGKKAKKDERVFNLDENKHYTAESLTLGAKSTLNGKSLAGMKISEAYEELKKDYSGNNPYKDLMIPLWRMWAEQNPEQLMKIYSETFGKKLISSKVDTETDSARPLADILSEVESPWTLPSTSIGNSIDRFVRDFFGNKLDLDAEDVESKYPNMTKEDMVRFKDELSKLRNHLENDLGYQLFPEGIIAHGMIEITEENGKIHYSNMAGTLDILAVDKNGDLVILDMKTYSTVTISKEKLNGYVLQMSLYAKLLEQQYGLKVSGIAIIPISVKYPIPKYVTRNGKSDNVTYTQHESIEDQLVIDGEGLFKGASPELKAVKPLNLRKDIDLRWEKLTDEERAVLEPIKTEQDGEAGGNAGDINIKATSDDITVDSNTGLKRNSTSSIFGKAFSSKRKSNGNIFDNLQRGNTVEDQISNPMRRDTEYTAEDIIEFYKEMNPNLPNGYFRMAEAVFNVCKELGIKFKMNSSLKHRGVYHNDTGVVEFADKVSLNTFLHEAIHASTTYYFNHPDRESLPKHIQRAIKELESCYSEMKKIMEEHFAKMPEGLKKDLTKMDMQSNDSYYGLSSVTEFIAELSNPLFRATIQRYDAKYSKKGIFRRIIDAIADMLNIKRKGSTIEERAYKALRTLLENSDMQAFQTTKSYMEGGRRMLNMLKDSKNNFHTIDVKLSTFNNLEGDFTTGHSKTVTIPYYSERQLRRGSLFEGNVIDENGNFQEKVVIAVTNNPKNNNDGTQTLDIRLVSPADFEGNQYRINRDENGYVYLTRNPNAIGLGITRFIPASLKFGVWEGVTNELGEKINVEKSIENISKFYTEREWNALTNEEMEHEIQCKGVF